VQKIADFIQKTNKNCIFISPHIDDFVLSCYEIAQELLHAQKNIFVINIFTSGSENLHTTTINWMLHKSGFSSATEYFSARKKEDLSILQPLSIKGFYLDYVEAGWREPYLHRSFDSIFDSKNKGNPILEKNIEKRVRSLLSKEFSGDQITLFSPLAIGHHVDHIIIRNVSQRLSRNTLFWEDYPYNSFSQNKLYLSQLSEYKNIFTKKSTNQKKEILKQYYTQYYSLFPTNSPTLKPEVVWESKANNF
jgi:hypothetical protein